MAREGRKEGDREAETAASAREREITDKHAQGIRHNFYINRECLVKWKCNKSTKSVNQKLVKLFIKRKIIHVPSLHTVTTQPIEHGVAYLQRTVNNSHSKLRVKG